MKTNWLRLLKALISPTALGLYITLTFVWLSFIYYASRDSGLQSGLLVQSIRRAHEVSIDYRLLARGPIKSPAPVVLLTVDEKAVETLGRWPWPRSLIASGIDRAINDGAKVLGFDIIFAEEERNELLTASQKLLKDGVIHQELFEQMSQIAQEQDGDQALSLAFENHQSQTVAGSFYSHYDEQSFPPGHVDLCYDLAFRTTKDFEIWDQEEILVSIQDPFQSTPPYPLLEFFNQSLAQLKDSIRAQFPSELNAVDQLHLKQATEEKISLACETFFEDLKEEIEPLWESAVLAKLNPNEFQYPTYSDWLNDFKEKVKPNGIPRVRNWNLNVSEISKNIVHTGFFNAQQDSDGTFRSSPLVARTGLFTFPSLALKTYLVGTDRNASLKLSFNPATGRKEVTRFEITDNNTGEVVETIPTDGQGRLLINYAGPAFMFPHLSFAELLSHSDTLKVHERIYDEKSKTWEERIVDVPRKEFLKDKFLLVGATATGIFDLRVTPFEKRTYPGLEIHANILANLLEKNFLKPWEDERSQVPVFLLFLGVAHVLILTQLGALSGMATSLFLILGILGLDKFYLFDKGIVVTIVWPLLLVLALYITLTTYRYLTEERGKKELRATFQKYVSPSIVEEILADPKNIALGGKKMNLTVFFSDVRGFTTISEKLDPRALSDLLNEYLTPMTEIVFHNQGTLDKYMGDAIMAFFGAPIPLEKHAHYACRAALQSLEKLFELQKEFAARGLPQIDIGIGLNSGEVSAGNMGSETVRSYTVMGDAVNLASRLEGINKEYGTRIVISEFTQAQVKDHFTTREIDWVRVKGKTQPIKIFELIKEGALDGAELEHLRTYKSAYTLYREQRWSEARDLFSHALTLKSDDEVSRMFISRCANYIDSPPEDGWDGVFEMKTK